MDLHRRHGGVAWRLYDERFRRIRAMAPDLTWRWALFIAAPSVARWRHKHRCPFARGRHGPPCVPHRACASTSITAAPAPVRPVASGTPVSRAARATQAAHAMLRAPGRAAAGLPSPVRVHRLNCYLCDYVAALRDSLVGGFTHGFRIPSSSSILLHTTMHLPFSIPTLSLQN